MEEPPILTRLDVGDPPELWDRLGFAVADATTIVGDVMMRHVTGTGITGWALDAATPVALAHLPRPAEAAAPPRRSGRQPNGIVGVDHVVLRVGDLDAARDDLHALRIEVRRERAAALGGIAVVQLFAWLGPTILEVVGPAVPDGSPAHLWGLTFVSHDLDGTVAALGEAAGPPRPAVQPGRHISSLDTRPFGGTVRIAVMSPHPRAASPSPGTSLRP